MQVQMDRTAVYENGGFSFRDIVFSQQKPYDGVSVFSLPNCFLLPGFVDVHVHLREPGFSYKETIATGTMAAARGGYSDVCAMPNLSPAPDCPANLQPQLDAIAKGAAVRVHPYGTITMGERGEALSHMAAMADKVVAFSDDGRGVQSDSLMEQAMLEAKRLGKIIAAHCEDNTLLRGGYIHDGEYARLHGHRGIRRDLALAKKTGCAYHVCHISAKESVSLIRQAKAEGVDVTCETGPHYLVFNDMDLQEDGRFKMNPPIRSEDDRQALLEGVLDGTIDMIATDHAPHSAEEKSRGLEKSLMGVVGLETAFPVLYTKLVKPGILPLSKLVALLSDNPRRRFGLPQKQDYSLWDLEETYTIDPTQFASMGKATPFAGMQVWGKCKMTIVEGEIVWLEK